MNRKTVLSIVFVLTFVGLSLWGGDRQAMGCGYCRAYWGRPLLWTGCVLHRTLFPGYVPYYSYGWRAPYYYSSWRSYSCGGCCSCLDCCGCSDCFDCCDSCGDLQQLCGSPAQSAAAQSSATYAGGAARESGRGAGAIPGGEDDNARQSPVERRRACRR